MFIGKLKQAVFLIIFSFSSANIFAQDTVRLNIEAAEKIFLQKNSALLAQKYNIDAQRALIIQARLYPNPNISYVRGLNKPDSLKAEQAVQIQQVILLAGKRKKQIAMAETNTLLAEDNYLDLLRTLKYTLRSDFFSIYYWQQTSRVYDEEINALKKILTAFEKEMEKGYIAKTEVMRVKAQLYSLQSEYNDLRNQINDAESEVRTVIDSLGIYIVPIIDTVKIANVDPLKYPLSTLLDSAAKNRSDLMTARHNLALSNQNYKYQKALAVPDVTLSGSYDTYGSAWPFIKIAGVSMDIPVFNRNQGNIKSSKFQIKSDEAALQSVQIQYEENVYRSLEKAITQHNLYKSLDKNFPKEMDILSKAVLDNYTKRNIGLLDFLNFYDSYKQNIVQLNNILGNLANSYENIDFMTGTDFFYK